MIKRVLLICIISMLSVTLFYCKNNSTSSEDDDTIKDIDGNVYTSVIIGDQEWMVENLKVTHYRNGDAIPNVTDFAEWSSLSSGANCHYENNIDNADTYGLLYNWYSVIDTRNLAPEGWHIPSKEEWQTLVDYLGGADIAGGKLKEAGYSHWESPNTGAINEIGFTIVPAGERAATGFNTDGYMWLGKSTKFWTSTETLGPWIIHISYNSSEVGIAIWGYTESQYKWAYSIRCIKD